MSGGSTSQNQAMARKQAAQRAHMHAFVDRFRYKASKARQAQSRIKMLEKMERIAAVTEDTVAPFSFPEPVKTVASPIVAMEKVSVGYQPGSPILKGMNLRIDQTREKQTIGIVLDPPAVRMRPSSNRSDPLPLDRDIAVRDDPVGEHQISSQYKIERLLVHFINQSI